MNRFTAFIAIIACGAAFTAADASARDGSKSRRGRSPSSVGRLAPRTMADRAAVPTPGSAATMLEASGRPSLLGENSSSRTRGPRLMLQQDRPGPRIGVLSPQFRHADISLKWQ